MTAFGNKFFYQVAARTILEKFDNFRDEWDEFQKIHGTENDFFMYIDRKIADLRKDIDWLRKTYPKSKNDLEL